MSTSPTNLHIAVIGVGMIGEPIARLFTQAGHTVKIANSREPDTLKAVAQRTGATAATIDDAVHNAHLIVVAIPANQISTLDKRLFMSLQHPTIVVDATNYYPDTDGRIDELEGGLVESRWVETQLGRPVIKVFNNIDAYSLDKRGKPTGTDGRIALPVSGTDAIHKATVIALLDQMGFDGVDAGNVEESWRQQPGTPVYCTNHDVEGVRGALLKADKSKSAAVRDATNSRVQADFKGGPETWENLYAVQREIVEEQYGE